MYLFYLNVDEFQQSIASLCLIFVTLDNSQILMVFSQIPILYDIHLSNNITIYIQ